METWILADPFSLILVGWVKGWGSGSLEMPETQPTWVVLHAKHAFTHWTKALFTCLIVWSCLDWLRPFVHLAQYWLCWLRTQDTWCLAWLNKISRSHFVPTNAGLLREHAVRNGIFPASPWVSFLNCCLLIAWKGWTGRKNPFGNLQHP